MVNHSGRNTEDNTNSFTKTEKKGGNRGERNMEYLYGVLSYKVHSSTHSKPASCMLLTICRFFASESMYSLMVESDPSRH